MTHLSDYSTAKERIQNAKLHGSNELVLSGLYLDTLPPGIESLTFLQTLDLNANQLAKLPPEIGELTALRELYIYGNGLTELPSEIGRLTSLEKLVLGSNQLTTLPPEIGSLASLRILVLADNQLKTLPSQLRNVESTLEQIYLHNNPGLDLSPEVLGPQLGQRGPSPSPRSIFDAYFNRQSGTARPLNEVKLIIVGRGGAGKTSVIRALHGLPFRARESSTAGIALSDYSVKDCPGGTVTAHIWDFAGQIITHALHQFFFSVRSVYVLVLTGRENSEREDAEYWLRLINAFGTDKEGKGPPVLVALNKWDVEGCRPKVDCGALRERYPNIRGFIEFDCRSRRGVPKLKAALKKEIGRLKWVREPFKRQWDDVRRELNKPRGPAYISYAEFRRLCQRFEVLESSEQDSLAEILHNLGSALNYRNDPRLREATVLRPPWLTQNVYMLVRKAEKQFGALTRADVDAALKKVRDKSMRDYLMRLMERFEIAYPARTRDVWVVPQALPDEQPRGAETFGAEQGATRLRYVYTALPEGLVARAIVRLHEFIEETRGKRRQWAGGAILTRGGARALLRTEPQDRHVMVTVIGPQDARRQLAGLCQAEMRDIHAEIPGLNPREETQFEGIWIPTNQLEADERRNRQTGFGSQSEGTKFVDPKKINNAFTKQEARNDGIWKPRAFLSYSKVNVERCRRLGSELKILQSEGLLAYSWYDRMITPGEEWDTRIQRELLDSDLILFLLTSDTLATDYVVEKEIPLAMQRHETGEAIVVPVILEDCRWEKTALGKLQAVPDKGKAINRWNPQSPAWKAVADGLANLLLKLQEQRQ